MSGEVTVSVSSLQFVHSAASFVKGSNSCCYVENPHCGEPSIKEEHSMTLTFRSLTGWRNEDLLPPPRRHDYVESINEKSDLAMNKLNVVL